jgi:hypothetical protein
MPDKPPTIMENKEAPKISVSVHPNFLNSSDNETEKMPKEYRILQQINVMRKDAITTIHP